MTNKLLLDYLNVYTAGSESPQHFHAWSFLSIVSAALGRKISLPFGFTDIYPNQYIMLIGSPGSRKSSAIKAAVKLLKDSGYKHTSANKTTKEKFLLDLAGVDNQEINAKGNNFEEIFGDMDLRGASNAQMLIAADEFTNFIGAGNYEFISLLGELWDCPDDYDNRMKNSKSYTIREPVINIIGGNTATGFATAFPPEVIGQGFISRLLLIYGERTDVRNTIPPRPCPKVHAQLVSKLQEISELSGAVILEGEAFDAVDTIYKNWQDVDDVRFANYSSRRLTHLLKLCMVFAAMSLRTYIIIEDVISAHTILTQAELNMPRALGEFGKGKHSEVASKVMDMLEKEVEPVPMTAIWKHVSMDLERMTQLADVIAGLTAADKIIQTKYGILPKRKVVNNGAKIAHFYNPELIGG